MKLKLITFNNNHLSDRKKEKKKQITVTTHYRVDFSIQLIGKTENAETILCLFYSHFFDQCRDSQTLNIIEYITSHTPKCRNMDGIERPKNDNNLLVILESKHLNHSIS